MFEKLGWNDKKNSRPSLAIQEFQDSMGYKGTCQIANREDSEQKQINTINACGYR